MNLAVFLPGWVGDAVMATPALRALRQDRSASHIVAVGKPYVADVFAGGDWFDEFIPCSGRGPWSHGVLAVAWRLRRMRIDLGVLFSNSFRTALIAWLGGCRQRIGFAGHGRSLLLSEVLQPLRDESGRRKPSPIIDDYNRLAEAAGCPPPGRRMQLFTTSEDEAAADAVWQQAGFAAYPEVICLNPGAAFGAAKHWPIPYFADLAGRFASERCSGVLVLCGPAEREQANKIAALAGHPAVRSLAELTRPQSDSGPRLCLGLTKACIERADLLVTTDSGPRHFAAAFDRPVVTLFGPTHIAWTETYHPAARHLQKQVECGPCQRRVCPLDHRCMKQLTPAEVFEAAVALLQRCEAPARDRSRPIPLDPRGP
jgi:heptosyltransferase-2